MTLPNPQLMADAQALTVFAQAVAQAASQLVNKTDPSTPEFQELKAYFKTNIAKLKSILDNLESDLGN